MSRRQRVSCVRRPGGGGRPLGRHVACSGVSYGPYDVNRRQAMDPHPGLFRRGIAMLIDLVVPVVCIVYLVRNPVFPGLRWANVILIVSVPLLYEPLLSAYACTVGQALTRTRIRASESMQRMGLKQTYMRFMIKYVATALGAMGSVGSSGAAPPVGMFPEADDRALHDLQAGTVVVSANAV